MSRVAILTPVLFLCFAIAALAQGPGQPDALRCEYTVNPMGIDVDAPRLSWELNDPRRGARQTAYQIMAAPSEDQLVVGGETAWDSGKVFSDQSIQVPYAGRPLGAGERMYWRIRYWDSDGLPSEWSQVAWWERGLPNSEDWQAEWISIEEARSEAEPLFGDWIWHPVVTEDEDTRYFRKVIELPEDAQVRSAQLWGAANNEFYCYVNGEYAGGCDEWKAVESKSFTSLLVPGTNIIAIRAVHDRLAPGFTFGARITLTDGQEIDVRSDGDWLSHDTKVEEWQALDLDTTAWVPARRMGAYGEPPYEAVGDRFPSRSFYLRKDFETHGPVRRARVYVSGLGSYQLYLNGQRVGQDELAPGWTHFKKHVRYQTYDVTEYLRAGENAMGMLLGNGWWGGCMAGAWKDGNLRGIAQLEITFDDGTRQLVPTDTSWKGTPSPILSDSIYNGETYDARLELPGWNAPGFDDGAWHAAHAVTQAMDTLDAQIGPGIQVTEELTADSITEPSPGVFIVDFGQNAAGRARLSVRGPAGTSVQIRHGEILRPDGMLYTENLRGAQCTDTYILKGDGEEIWEPTFSYRGFRYAELTGYPGTPTKESLRFRVMHTNVPTIGTFACSEEILNRVQENTVWGARSNFYSVPTDCPQRDERLGWTGDMQLFLPAACLNWDVAGYMTKWMVDIADSRNADGSIPDVAPALSAAAGAPGWSDVAVTVPWSLYTYYGDTRIIEEHYETMNGFLAFMQAQAKDGLFARGRYGDWVAVESSPRDPLAGAYQFLSTKRLAAMAAAIDRPAEAHALTEEAAQLAGRFNERYFDTATGEYQGGTQTANVIPLAFGITPTSLRDGVVARLPENIHAHDEHLTTGFVGTAYLMPTLSDFGEHKLAATLANNRSYPSWGYMVDSGATTIWERWNSNQPEAMDSGMNSFNHFTFGSVSQWYYEYLLGIRPLTAGFKHILIEPTIDGAQWARGAYHSMYGPIRCAWSKEGSFTMSVEIPPNTRAHIVTPVPCTPENPVGVAVMGDGTSIFEVGAGTYRFTQREATAP